MCFTGLSTSSSSSYVCPVLSPIGGSVLVAALSSECKPLPFQSLPSQVHPGRHKGSNPIRHFVVGIITFTCDYSICESGGVHVSYLGAFLSFPFFFLKVGALVGLMGALVGVLGVLGALVVGALVVPKGKNFWVE